MEINYGLIQPHKIYDSINFLNETVSHRKLRGRDAYVNTLHIKQ